MVLIEHVCSADGDVSNVLCENCSSLLARTLVKAVLLEGAERAGPILADVVFCVSLLEKYRPTSYKRSLSIES